MQRSPNLKIKKTTLLTIITGLFLHLFFITSLHATPNPTVTFPTNGTTYIEGDTVKITTIVSNAAVNTVVEFYINNVYVGNDTTAPYQYNWISVEGTHLLTAKETHGTCQKNTSVPIQVIVKKNVAPLITITAPTNGGTYFDNTPLHIAANASDTDGTINHVDFFANTIFIGSATTAPYQLEWTSGEGIYTITAKAVDNKGIQTTAAPIAVTVYPPVDSPPTIAITSPVNGSYFVMGSSITIKADAADADGVVTAVEFFANNVSIGIDATAPYEINWPGIIGLINISAKAIDNNCVATTSAPVQISVIDPNCPPYKIEVISGPCNVPTFCLPVAAVLPVNNVIGYDVILNYDKTKVHPTGNITISNDLINAGYASSVANNIDSLGQINISVFLTNAAPSTASFKGIGHVFCVEFTKTAAFAAGDSALFSISSLQESYVTGITAKQAQSGKYTNETNNVYPGTLKFWTDNSPIKYNAANPTQYLITNVYGTDLNCNHESPTAIQPDLSGKIHYNILNGASLQIERDILPVTDVQPVINGYDASLGYAVLVNDLSFIPTIYQAIALDVNMDGVISAGDISQISQRSIKTIVEFKQKWNYNSNGSSNGKVSKDWLFLDSTLLANPAYKRSATYPLNDGIGYSKYKVPVVPFCLTVPTSTGTTCNVFADGTFTGILLGDVNGNYDAIPEDGKIKWTAEKSKGTIYLDLMKAKTTKNYVDVPVSFSSTEKIVALDFALKFNDNALSYVKLMNPGMYLNDALANVDDDHTLRFTSNSRKNYEAEKTIAWIRFSTIDGKISSDDLKEIVGYLNGEPANAAIKKNLQANRIGSSSTTTVDDDKNVNVYPNPAGAVLNVWVAEKAVVQLWDLQGKEIFTALHANANEKLEIRTEDIANGTYLLKVSNEHFTSMQQVVIEN
jgi:hypothetical protein